jgi:hypothetical protein
MDDHFFNSEFDKFLQQQVKQHRMYPSDAVWKGIYKQIHGDRKWPGLYFIAILLVAALTVCTVFIESTPIVYPHAVVAKQKSIVDQLDPVQVTRETITIINNTVPVTSSPVSITTPIAELVDDAIAPAEKMYASASNGEVLNPSVEQGVVDGGMSHPPVTGTLALPVTEQKMEVTTDTSATLRNAEQKKTFEENTSLLQPEPTTSSIAISQPEKTGKWQYQIYITPSGNYRDLVDQKPSANQVNGPVANYAVNANQVVRYKPGMGIEFGLGVLYRLTDRLRIKTSLQYNIRQYNIEAFSGNYEMAKIALVRNGSVDSVSTLARYRSTNGFGEALLLNKYHQVSMPVGLEYALVDAKKFGINLGATLQPTYTFSQSSYLLTSDYKSYADGTSMIRRWNLNSSLEATFSYKVGDFQWKLGPQIRYQHLPTYSDPYPIKEYLIDYGFKIGFTKTIK